MGAGMLTGDTHRRAVVRVTSIVTYCSHVAVEDQTGIITLKTELPVENSSQFTFMLA